MARASASGLCLQAGTVPGARSSVSDTPALQALSKSTGISSYRTRKSRVMQAITTSDLGPVVTTCSPSKVDAPGSRFQVGWIHAATDATQMVQVNLPAQGAMFPNIERPVSKLGTEQDPAELPVPVPVDRPLPEPAAPMIHNVSGPVVNEGAVGGASLPESCVVLAAQSKLESTMDTVRIVN